MKGLDLSVVEQETGLGIITQKNLRPRLFCREAVKKAKILLGQIMSLVTDIGMFL